MSLDKIPPGATVFVDSNVLTYYLAGDSSLASAYLPFFDRVADDELIAVTSVVVVMEVIHRVIVLEAIEKLQLERKRTVQYLKEHPDVVKNLVNHRTVPSQIYRLGVSIEPITYVHIHHSRQVRQKYGLMANDSLTIAFMQRHKVRHLLTNDRDFRRIPEIEVWLPSVED